MDLPSASDDLYAAPPDEFVERRKALVAEARTAKDRALATAIGKLRRPTRSAWLVNMYARRAVGELNALLDLGAALQAAQEQLSVAELRRLSGERQKLLAAATRSAVALGVDEGYTATEAVRQEVTQTLQAALADPDVAAQVRSGTVTEAQAYGGFGVFAVGTASTGTANSDDSAETQGSEETTQDAEDTAERAAAEERLQEAEAALVAAADEAEEATQRADALADRVESLRQELAELDQAEGEARQLARAARATVADRQAEVTSAREAYEAL